MDKTDEPDRGETHSETAGSAVSDARRTAAMSTAPSANAARDQRRTLRTDAGGGPARRRALGFLLRDRAVFWDTCISCRSSTTSRRSSPRLGQLRPGSHRSGRRSVAAGVAVPAMIILLLPGGFRHLFTTGSPLRAFWFPPRRPARREPHKSYSGETRFRDLQTTPLVLLRRVLVPDPHYDPSRRSTQAAAWHGSAP